ncbi:MAG: hypothetical protein IPG58_16620 [Acidobacteria bacterium]|nr:hypothetical protein [Acidobacteriota bacterium]
MVQRKPPFQIGVEAIYIYLSGRYLAVSREPNAIPAQYLNNLSVTSNLGDDTCFDHIPKHIPQRIGCKAIPRVYPG